MVAAVSVLAVPFAAWLLYARLGAPALPDQPFAARTTPAKATAGIEHIDLGEAVGKIAAHLKEHPEDLRGWLLLGRTELSLGHYAEAVDAYRHAADLSGHRADIMGDWGEAQVIAADGTVTPAVAATAQATAGASQEERRAMILAMVGNLAARLEQQPDDIDGWARLGRSYMVLNEPQKAREAYAHAVKLKPDDAALQQAYAEASRAAENGTGK